MENLQIALSSSRKMGSSSKPSLPMMPVSGIFYNFVAKQKTVSY